jgi:hypothetical protein
MVWNQIWTSDVSVLRLESKMGKKRKDDEQNLDTGKCLEKKN